MLQRSQRDANPYTILMEINLGTFYKAQLRLGLEYCFQVWSVATSLNLHDTVQKGTICSIV